MIIFVIYYCFIFICCKYVLSFCRPWWGGCPCPEIYGLFKIPVFWKTWCTPNTFKKQQRLVENFQIHSTSFLPLCALMMCTFQKLNFWYMTSDIKLKIDIFEGFSFRHRLHTTVRRERFISEILLTRMRTLKNKALGFFTDGD